MTKDEPQLWVARARSGDSLSHAGNGSMVGGFGNAFISDD
jgi:hypothetical protein